MAKLINQLIRLMLYTHYGQDKKIVYYVYLQLYAAVVELLRYQKALHLVHNFSV